IAVIGGYDTFLNGSLPLLEKPDVIFRFGGVPTSNNLNAYLDKSGANRQILIDGSGVWADDNHRVTDFIQMDATSVCRVLFSNHGETDWTRLWRSLESTTWEATTQALNSGDDFDAAFIYDLIEALPQNAHLFVGNSLPIRHVDQFGKPSAKNIHIFGNRGASGIDGNVSTALGVASQTDEPLVLLIGDITFYHDMNGLLAIRNLNLNNVTIVLMNNNGGGIFNRLPISGYDPAFTDLFIMPHNLQFEHAAKLYGIDLVTVTDRPTFRQLVSEKIASAVPHIVEVRTNIQHDEQRRKEVIQVVKNALQAKMQTGESK
ncbi:MAG: thiamine pyrophosphate-dependent enzyme, partial [Chloroflexota bacterium]